MQTTPWRYSIVEILATVVQLVIGRPCFVFSDKLGGLGIPF